MRRSNVAATPKSGNQKMTNKTFVYVRVSTNGQTHASQMRVIERLNNVDLNDKNTVVYTEKETAKGTFHERPVFEEILRNIREGDRLVVYKIDRIGRNVSDMMKILEHLEDNGARLIMADSGKEVDLKSAEGKLFFTMCAMFAEYDLNLRKERQAEGIAAKKANGKKFHHRTAKRKSEKSDLIKKLLTAPEGYTHKEISTMANSTVSYVKKVSSEFKRAMKASQQKDGQVDAFI